MPEFVMNGSNEPEFQALDYFTRGYIEALFFTEEESLCEESGRDMPSVVFNMETMESRFVGGDSPGFADLAKSAIANIVEDCFKFQKYNETLLSVAYSTGEYDSEQAGRDFWFTRNGHGVGFWDRPMLEKILPDGEDVSDEYERLTNAMVEAGYDSAAWHAALAARNALTDRTVGTLLSEVARGWDSVYVYVGDDGKVYTD